MWNLTHGLQSITAEQVITWHIYPNPFCIINSLAVFSTTQCVINYVHKKITLPFFKIISQGLQGLPVGVRTKLVSSLMPTRTISPCRKEH